MPRLLPWKTGPTKPSRLPGTPKRKDKSPSPNDEDLLDENLNLRHPVKPSSKSTRRAPSSSPSLADNAAITEPEVQYMRKGTTADDRWMMVEDEFYSTATSFTRHIHHAEYKKRMSAVKSSKLPRDRSHLTDGTTIQSASTKLSLEADSREQSIRRAMEVLGQESDDSDDVEPHLAGLMRNPRLQARDLSDFVKVHSNTRAAAGFAKSPNVPGRFKNALPTADDETDDDDDDLDRPSARTRMKSPLQSKVHSVSTQNEHAVVHTEQSKTSSSSHPRKAMPEIEDDWATNIPRIRRRDPKAMKMEPLFAPVCEVEPPSDAIEEDRWPTVSHDLPPNTKRRKLPSGRAIKAEHGSSGNSSGNVKIKAGFEVPTFMV